MPPKKETTVNWIHAGKQISTISEMPPEVYGFCYMITIELDKEQFYYIGQKKLISRQKKKLTQKEIAELPNKRVKKWRYVEKEMDWQNYLGSNKPLLELIKTHGHKKLKLHKEILSYAFDAEDLKYQEAREIICQNALLQKCFFNDGVSIRMFKKHVK